MYFSSEKTQIQYARIFSSLIIQQAQKSQPQTQNVDSLSFLFSNSHIAVRLKRKGVLGNMGGGQALTSPGQEMVPTNRSTSACALSPVSFTTSHRGNSSLCCWETLKDSYLDKIQYLPVVTVQSPPTTTDPSSQGLSRAWSMEGMWANGSGEPQGAGLLQTLSPHFAGGETEAENMKQLA